MNERNDAARRTAGRAILSPRGLRNARARARARATKPRARPRFVRVRVAADGIMPLKLRYIARAYCRASIQASVKRYERHGNGVSRK